MSDPESPETSGICYEVKMGRMGRVEHPDKLITGAVLTCHAIAIINTKKRIAYLGHFPNFTMHGQRLLDGAIKEADSPEDLKVVAVGNIPISKELAAIVKMDFEKALEQYREHGRRIMDMIRSKGIPEGNIRNALEENPRKGSFEVEVDTETCEIAVREEYFECDFDEELR